MPAAFNSLFQNYDVCVFSLLLLAESWDVKQWFLWLERWGLTDISLHFCFRIIYKCSMCDTVFTLQTLLYRHFDQHIENQKVSVFKCPDCSLLYAQKQLMMDHIKVCTHLFCPLNELQIHSLVVYQGWAADYDKAPVLSREGGMLVVVNEQFTTSCHRTFTWLREAFHSWVLICISWESSRCKVANACPHFKRIIK